MTDYPGVNKSRFGQLDIGKGPGISQGANTNPAVLALLTKAARAEGISYQVNVAPGATPTDANALQLNRSGMVAGLLSVPLRYMHTPCEILSLKDVEDTACLLAAYCRRIISDTDFTPW